MTYPDPDRAYGGSERQGPNIRLYPLARWWNLYAFPEGDGIGLIPMGSESTGWTLTAWQATQRGVAEGIGIYRGRAWPRFWLAKVEVTE